MLATDLLTIALDDYMARRWPDARRLNAYVREVWTDYQKLDIGDLDQVVSQLTNDDDEQFWQRLWELQLGSHLFRLGRETRSPVKGPDFRFDASGLTVWVKAVSPAPRGIPATWFAFPDIRAAAPSWSGRRGDRPF